MLLLIKYYRILTILVLCYFIFFCESKNYCSPNFCNNSKEHVLCQFQSSGPARNCIDYEMLLKTAKDKNDILDKINSRRNKVASGEIRSLPASEDMEKLEWYEELEMSAQRWADQCMKQNLYDGTDSCRDLENTSVGQNIATVYGDAPGLTALSLIDLWYMELLNINSTIMHHYVSSSKTGLQHYDYFTQLVWGNTNQVGCGGVKFKEIMTNSRSSQNRTVHRLVCNFAPAGNNIGQPVYKAGISCSHCLLGHNCDPTYRSLCSKISHITKNESMDFGKSKKYSQKLFNYINSNSFIDVSNVSRTNKVTNSNTEHSLTMPRMLDENDTQFDLFSYIFEITKLPFSQTVQSTTKCKEVLAVEEFIELLKNRLSNDQILKDLLLSTTTIPTSESTFTDRTVAAIVKQLYSKKETQTTSKSTESDELNSTLLVDLVEAVIFRHSDKYSTTEDTISHTQNIGVVIPIRIQAELGEVKSNKEFTGHYFFPEEEDQAEQETTEIYDDTENLPISDISLEIEDLKRNRGTKDFLEEILESDFMTDTTTRDSVLPTVNGLNGENTNDFNISSSTNKENSTFKQNKRFKRKTKDDFLINYSDLLIMLANDLKKLKLYEKFHCSYNSENKLVPKFLLLSLYTIACIFVSRFIIKTDGTF